MSTDQDLQLQTPQIQGFSQDFKMKKSKFRLKEKYLLGNKSLLRLC